MTIHFVKLSVILAIFNSFPETFTFPLEKYTIDIHYDEYNSGYEIIKLNEKRFKYNFTPYHVDDQNQSMLEMNLLTFVPLAEKSAYSLQKDRIKYETPIGKQIQKVPICSQHPVPKVD